MDNSPASTQTLPPSELTSPQPLTPQSTTSSKWLVPVLALLIPVAAMVGYYFGQQSLQTSPSVQVSQTSPPPVTTPTPLASPEPSPIVKTFSKRLFNPTQDWALNRSYPPAVLAINESELVGLFCLGRFEATEAGKYSRYNLTTQEYEPLLDEKIIDTVALITKSSGKRVDAFTHCETEDGRTLYEFEEHAGGGGGNNVVYVAEIKGSKYQQVGSLPNTGAPYFGCNVPLMLTKTGQFYLTCGGGDGGFGAAGIYRLDISAKKFTEVAYCSSQATGDGSEKIECR